MFESRSSYAMKRYIVSNSHTVIMTNDLSNRHTNREPTPHTQNPITSML